MRFVFSGGDHSLSPLSGSLTKRVSTSARVSVVAVLTAVDVGGRALPALVARLLDTDLVPVTLTFLFSALANAGVFPAFASVAPFVLYGYLVYTLVPRLFPGRLKRVTERRDFRLMATVYVLLVPLLVRTSGPEWDSLLLLSGLGVLPLYLVVVQRGTILGRDGYPVAMTNAFFPLSDVQETFEDDFDVRDSTLTFWVQLTAFGLISVMYSWFVFLIAGVLLFFLSLVYPVPELLVSGWVGQRALLRAPFGPDETVLDRTRLDLEARVLLVVRAAFEGFKGFASVVMAVTGLGFGVILLWIAIYNVGTFVDLATRMPTFSLARLSMVVMGTLTLCGIALYGVWYWVRMLTRVPPFLDAWRSGLTSEVETEPEREEWFLPTRPPGYFLPPMLLWWVLPVVSSGTWESPRPPPAWAVLAWLAAFALTVWTAYRALVSPPQPARTDQRALPVSFFLTTVGAWIASDLVTEGEYDFASSYVGGLLTGRVSIDQFSAVLAEPGALFALTLVALPLYGFWIGDIVDWSHRDDWAGYAYVPYSLVVVAVLGTVAALTTTLWIWTRLFFAVAAAAFLGVTSVKLFDDLDIVDVGLE